MTDLELREAALAAFKSIRALDRLPEDGRSARRDEHEAACAAYAPLFEEMMVRGLWYQDNYPAPTPDGADSRNHSASRASVYAWCN